MYIKYFLQEYLIYVVCYVKEKHILLIINILLKDWRKKYVNLLTVCKFLILFLSITLT